MQKKNTKKLTLNKETLTAMQLGGVVGGISVSGCITKPRYSCGDACTNICNTDVC